MLKAAVTEKHISVWNWIELGSNTGHVTLAELPLISQSLSILICKMGATVHLFRGIYVRFK